MAPAPLPPHDRGARLVQLRGAVADAGADGIAVTDLHDIRYLSGFTGSNATLLVSAHEVALITDGRYREQAADQLAAAGVDAALAITRDTVGELARRSAGLDRLAVQAEHLSLAMHRRWAATVLAELVPTEGLVLGLRAVKDEAEVARLARAADITDAALADVRHLLAEGLTERDFARSLEAAIVEHGGDGPSFQTIVASGPNAARPHARPSDRRIGESGGPETVIVDVGTLLDGYHSDMTRTFVVGDPTPTQQRMLDVVTSAQAAGVAAVRAGIDAAEVDAVCRDAIADAGWAEAFVHGTGHGIGLEIHEEPRLAADSDDRLDVGHCVTVEPGVYLPEHGGVRVEDSVVVTATGCRHLTLSPYEAVP